MKGVIKNQVLTILMDRNPNYVSEILMRENIVTVDIDSIQDVLNELVAEEIVEQKEFTNKSLALAEKYYRLINSENYPVRQFIKLGDIEIPRLLIDSSPSVFPEIFNEQIERLALYTKSLEGRFTDQVKKEQQKYWGNVVGILGVVVSVLAIIIVGLPKIVTDPTLPFWNVVILNLGQLLQLAVVLILLVFLLRWVVR